MPARLAAARLGAAPGHAVVAAAGGVRMARHGARALTSSCGTVDLLESVGIDVECDVETVARSIREVGIGLFLGGVAVTMVPLLVGLAFGRYVLGMKSVLLLGALAGGQSGDNSALLQTVMQLVNNPQNGGLEGLIQSFQQGGLGEIVNSWLSTGQNLPISAEQIQSVLGDSSLSGLAAQLGVSPEQASGSLADMLPQLIDQLTPNGQMPQGGDLLTQGLDMLKKGGLFG